MDWLGTQWSRLRVFGVQLLLRSLKPGEVTAEILPLKLEAWVDLPLEVVSGSLGGSRGSRADNAAAASRFLPLAQISALVFVSGETGLPQQAQGSPVPLWSWLKCGISDSEVILVTCELMLSDYGRIFRHISTSVSLLLLLPFQWLWHNPCSNCSRRKMDHHSLVLFLN